MPDRVGEICYLCGQSIEGDASDDHVPPKQLYASRIRQLHPLNLLTLPTHKDCNTSYQPDEDYFVASVGPLAYETYAGAALVWDTRRRLAHERERQPDVPAGGLTAKVLGEFDFRPGGLHLPPGRVVKRFEGARIERVLWKIVQGLFYWERGRLLPSDDVRRLVWMQFPGDERNPMLTGTLEQIGRGRYPGVFDYKSLAYPAPRGGLGMEVWAMLFWDRLIAGVAFHDPACECEECAT